MSGNETEYVKLTRRTALGFRIATLALILMTAAGGALTVPGILEARGLVERAEEALSETYETLDQKQASLRVAEQIKQSSRATFERAPAGPGRDGLRSTAVAAEERAEEAAAAVREAELGVAVFEGAVDLAEAEVAAAWFLLFVVLGVGGGITLIVGLLAVTFSISAAKARDSVKVGTPTVSE